MSTSTSNLNLYHIASQHIYIIYKQYYNIIGISNTFFFFKEKLNGINMENVNSGRVF